MWSKLAEEADSRHMEESRGKRGFYTKMAKIEAQLNNVMQTKMVVEVLLSSPDKTQVKRANSFSSLDAGDEAVGGRGVTSP